jgi:hypothetical protein
MATRTLEEAIAPDAEGYVRLFVMHREYLAVTKITVGSFLPGLGWLAPAKSTRAWEPTLSWNRSA